MVRHFVTFKKGTNLYGKVMVFTNLLRNEIQDRLVQHYDQLWDKIYTEPELSRVMPETIQKGEFIHFGTEGYTLNQEHKVSVSDITLWFKTAKPCPTQANLFTQLGAMYEEVAESVSALNNQLIEEYASDMKLADLHTKVQNAKLALEDLANAMYKTDRFPLSEKTKIDLLDALADITVTTTGSAQYAGFDFDGALTNVNQSNWSKFENNKPVLREDGKIMKGKDYKAPELKPFIGK